MIDFKKEPSCPKCDVPPLNIEYTINSAGGEYLKCTCGTCGYNVGMECASTDVVGRTKKEENDE